MFNQSQNDQLQLGGGFFCPRSPTDGREFIESSDLAVTLSCHLIHPPMPGCTQASLACWLKAFLDMTWLRNAPFVREE